MTPQYALSTYCMSLRPFHSWLRLLPPHILYITYSLHCLYIDSLVVNTHLNYSHIYRTLYILYILLMYVLCTLSVHLTQASPFTDIVVDSA